MIFQLVKIPRFVMIHVCYFNASGLFTATSTSWKKQAESNQSLIWAIKLPVAGGGARPPPLAGDGLATPKGVTAGG